jgi:hypothetical protein
MFVENRISSDHLFGNNAFWTGPSKSGHNFRGLNSKSQTTQIHFRHNQRTMADIVTLFNDTHVNVAKMNAAAMHDGIIDFFCDGRYYHTTTKETYGSLCERFQKYHQPGGAFIISDGMVNVVFANRDLVAVAQKGTCIVLYFVSLKYNPLTVNFASVDIATLTTQKILTTLGDCY